MQAADVMTFGVATVSSDASIEEAARLMLQHRVSGLPVVDDQRRLVGIVTEGDLVRSQREDEDSQRPRWLRLLLSGGADRQVQEKARRRTVGEVMTTAVVTVTPDTPVAEIAEMMDALGIKRVPVTEGESILGIVSRADLLRGLARRAEEVRSASADDLALRARVLQALDGVPTEGWRSLNVTVRDGVAELRGAVTSDAQRERLLSAARGVSGVRSVTDRLVTVSPEAAGRA